MNILRKAADWLNSLVGSDPTWRYWTGASTSSGEVVTPELAIQTTAVWSAMKIIGESVGTLPLHVYERKGDAKVRAQDYPLYPILHDSPNPDMGAADFFTAQTAVMALHGNCYSEVARNSRDEVVALWPIPAQQITVERTGANGDLTYRHTPPTGRPRTIQPADMLHSRTLSLDGIRGLSPIMQCRDPIGLSRALEKFAGTFFANGAVPLIILEPLTRVDEKVMKEMRESWKATVGGVDRANDVAVAPTGVKVNKIGANPQEAQSIESRKFQIAEIARIYRIPPHMLADLDRATFSNIEHLSLEFVKFTLMPWLRFWEQAIQRTLIPAKDRRRFFVEFSVDALLRADIKSRNEAYAIGRQWGWYSVNDICRFENLDPIGPEGDVYLTPLNMIPAGEPVPQRSAPGSSPDGRQMATTFIPGAYKQVRRPTLCQ